MLGTGTGARDCDGSGGATGGSGRTVPPPGAVARGVLSAVAAGLSRIGARTAAPYRSSRAGPNPLITARACAARGDRVRGHGEAFHDGVPRPGREGVGDRPGAMERPRCTKLVPGFGREVHDRTEPVHLRACEQPSPFQAVENLDELLLPEGVE